LRSREIGRLIDVGLVMPQVTRVFPLEQPAQAERELETQHVRGKIVLKVAA